jgi:hypothetical protein
MTKRISRKIYVAGPMQGYPDFNFPAFETATYTLRKQGWEVCNPAEKDLDEHGESFGKGTQGTLEEVPEFSLRRALAYDTNWICTEADAIFMLKGWEKSRGATAEHALAIALGHEIIYA